jgi:hypothetical protein
MEWSGRAPALPATNAGRGTADKEHAMSQNPDTSPAVIGIDIGKNSFHIVGQNQRGAIVLRLSLSETQSCWQLISNRGDAPALCEGFVA